MLINQVDNDIHDMTSENKHINLSICKEISSYLLINQVYNDIHDMTPANKHIHLSIINHLARPLPTATDNMLLYAQVFYEMGVTYSK